MFKRLTAILITLAMLFGMCAVVTADTVLSGEETLLVFGDYKALRKCFDI